MSQGGVAIRTLFISILLLTIALPVLGGAGSGSAIEDNWLALAKQYVRADEKLLRLEQNKQKGILQQLDLRDDLRANLEHAPSPSIDQLTSLLRSLDPFDRKTALVVTFLRHITSLDLTKLVLNRYNDESDFFIRFYSHQVLMNLSDEQVRTVQADILRISRNEKYETILVTSLPTLLRLERDAVVPVLVGYFKKGSPGLKRATYATLRSSHDNYLEEIRSILKRDKAKGALAFIDRLDKL